MRNIDIILRVQGRSDELANCLASLRAQWSDVADLAPRLSAINPCWDRPELTAILQAWPDIEVLMTSEGPTGLGVLSSLLRRSAAERRDALVLMTDTVMLEGGLLSLVRAAQASDGIGVLSPRCLGWGELDSTSDTAASLSSAEALLRFRTVAPLLPALRSASVCLQAAHLVTSPLLSTLCAAQADPNQPLPLGPDLPTEARRWGFATLLSNRAFVHRAPEASVGPSPSEIDTDPGAGAEAMVSPLLPGSRGHDTLVVDWSDTEGHHGDGCGSDVSAIRALANRAPPGLRLRVVCKDAAFRFHGLDEVVGIERVDPEHPGLQAWALRLQLPADWASLRRFHRMAPIGLCVAPPALGRLEALDGPPRRLWHALMQHANAVMLSSARDQAWLDALRAPGQAVPTHLLPCPTALAAHRATMPSGLGGHVLVIGDEADAMAERIRAGFPTMPWVSLGRETGQGPGWRKLRADATSPESVCRLMSEAHAIVLAGHVPPRLDDLLRVLASGKSLVLQRTAGLDEVLASYRHTRGVSVYDQAAEAESLLRVALSQGTSLIDDAGAPGWSEWAEAVWEVARSSMHDAALLTRLQARLAPSVGTTPEPDARPALPRAGATDLDHLLAHEDKDFVRMAYWTFLNRRADAEGERNFLYALYCGKTKLEVIDMIQGSPEGGMVKARLAGYTPLSRSSEVMPRRIVLVLGMHRSGTSALTRGLQALGVELGNNLYPPRPGENPKGYFEDADISNFDDRLLASIGRDWQHAGQLDAGLLEFLRQSGTFDQAVELLGSKSTGRSLLGVKDPRICKLLPFWQPVFDELGLDQSFVLAVRNPRSVARSLEVRNGFSRHKSYVLWLDHTLGSLSVVGRHRFAITDYDHLLTHPEAALHTIARRLDLYLDGPALQEYAAEFLDTGLRHAEFGPEDLANDPECMPLVREVYGRLQQMAFDNALADQPGFKDEIAAWKADFAVLLSSLARAEALEADNKRLRQALESLLAMGRQALAD